MKIIRVWGIVAFFVLSLLLLAGWYLLAPSLVKSSIEQVASEAVGAKVEVDSVSLGLFPLSVSLDRLQVTDSDQPMKNLFEAKQISFGLDTSALLWKKILIEELIIDGVQLATKRTSSGQLEHGRASEQVLNNIADIEIPEMTEEDIKQLVDKADLITVKRLNELNVSQQEMTKYWGPALEQEALEKEFVAIEAEFDRLKKRLKENKMNLLTDRKDWKKLKKSIDKERKKLADLKTRFDNDKKKLQQQIAQVKNGPKDDKSAIMKKLGLGNGAAGLSDKFLGPEYTPWVNKLLSFTEGMKGDNSIEQDGSETVTVYSTAQGTKVQFNDHQIFPDVLIKKIVLTGKDEKWKLSGLGSNIGHFPWLVGKPADLTLAINGEGNANLAVTSDWKSRREMNTNLSSKINNWPIEQVKLMQTNQGDWFVNSGTINANLTGQMTLETISLDLSVNMSNPNIRPPEGLTGWQKSVASSLNQQEKLNISMQVRGTIENPTIKISSSIEKILAQAIGDKIKQQAEKYSSKLTSAISNKVGDLSSLDGVMSDFDQWGEQLKGKDDLLKKLKSGI